MSVAETFLIAGIMIGIPVGMLLTWLFYALPLQRKRRLDERASAEANSILRQFANADTMVSSFDQGLDGYLPRHGRGPRPPAPALQQPAAAHAWPVQAGYRAVYPGNTGRLDEPDQQWLNWLSEYPSLDYFGPRDVRRIDPPPTQAPQAPLQTVETNLPWIRWRAGDWLLARLIAPVVRPGRSYPWWQKVADRVWEFMMVAEHHSVRWHRFQQRWLEQGLEAFAWGLREIAVGGFDELWSAVSGMPAALSTTLLQIWHGTPSMRPKRQYSLGEGR